VFSLVRPLPSSRSLASASFALSQVLLAGPTSPRRARPDYDFRLSGPVCMGFHQTPRRSPGSRSESFPTCLGSLTTPVRLQDSRSIALSPVAFPTYIQGRRPVGSFRSSMSQPAGTAVYASMSTSRCPPQDSRPKQFATPFFVGLFHPRISAGLPALIYLTHQC